MVKASIEKVWGFLIDIKRSAKCIPGCLTLDLVDDRTCQATIKSRTSLITAKFDSVISIVGVDPFKSIHANAKGEDRSIGSGFSAKGEVCLSPISEYVTKANYLLDVSIYGRLASFGDRVARIKISEMVRKCASNIARAIK